jgi:hypothetical protein
MDEGNNWIVVVLIIALVYSLFFHKQKYEGYTAEEWYDEYVAAQDALDQANSNIEDAKYYVGESYEEMYDALDNLETVSP